MGCKMPEGADYASKALEMDPAADLAIAATLAIQKLKQGDAFGARQLTLKYMALAQKYEPGLELAYILSSAMLNDKRTARRSWKRLTARYGLPATAKPREFTTKLIANPNLLREVDLLFDQADIF